GQQPGRKEAAVGAARARPGVGRRSPGSGSRRSGSGGGRCSRPRLGRPDLNQQGRRAAWQSRAGAAWARAWRRRFRSRDAHGEALDGGRPTSATDLLVLACQAPGSRDHDGSARAPGSHALPAAPPARIKAWGYKEEGSYVGPKKKELEIHAAAAELQGAAVLQAAGNGGEGAAMGFRVSAGEKRRRKRQQRWSRGLLPDPWEMGLGGGFWVPPYFGVPSRGLAGVRFFAFDPYFFSRGLSRGFGCSYTTNEADMTWRGIITRHD
ncbi:unnamed protein product, partial [Urochloa humidicola]